MLINWLQMPNKIGPMTWVGAALVRLAPHELHVMIGEDYYVIPSDYEISQYIINPTDKGPEGLFLAMCAYGKPPKLYRLPGGEPDIREMAEEILRPPTGFMSSEEFQERLLNRPKVKEHYLRLQDKQRRFKDAYETYDQLQQNSLEFTKSLKQSPLAPPVPENDEIPIYSDSPPASPDGIYLYANSNAPKKKVKPSQKTKAAIKKLSS